MKTLNNDRPLDTGNAAFAGESRGMSHQPTGVSAAAPTLSAAQAKARYHRSDETRNSKPLFHIPARRILKLKSAFTEKKLCDGPTFSLGLACGARCSYCYVESQLGRHPAILRIQKELGLAFADFAVQKENPLTQLRAELLNRKGAPKFADETDRRVVFSSPLVDVAANLPTAQQTVAACRLILENTHWQIRLLSKFALLKFIAEKLAPFRDRMIYGLSTGTFDDAVAASIEKGTSSPTARLRALHWLQDNGFRTFAMICPSLPQENYAAFANDAAQRVRMDRCEHVWAEVFNLRGKSLRKSCDALLAGGFGPEAQRLLEVSGKAHKAQWEKYSRATFLAHAAVVPPEKLRFLQYVRPDAVQWWRNQTSRGAILLGKPALAGADADQNTTDGE